MIRIKMIPLNLIALVRTTLAAAFAILLAGTIYSKVVSCPVTAPLVVNEQFDPRLSSITSIDGAEEFIRAGLTDAPSEEEEVDAVARFLRLRFYHSYSKFDVCSDWVAGLAGRFWDHMAAPVAPDQIMQYPMAACSQQTMVFQALIARFGMSYARIDFHDPGHMAPTAKIDGQWYYFDTNIEPKRDHLVLVRDVLKGDVLLTMYGDKRIPDRAGNIRDAGRLFAAAAKAGNLRFVGVNEYPAKNAILFHRVTGFVSIYGWAIALLLLMASVTVPKVYSRPRRTVA